MNFSSRFCNSCNDFVLYPAKSAQPDLHIRDYDTGNIFCFIKGTKLLSPSVMPSSLGRRETIIPLKGPDEPRARLLSKAEEIITTVETGAVMTKSILDGKLFYVRRGYLFDQNKNPLLIVCYDAMSTSNIVPVVCVDYSVFENPEEPMNRFIMRKFLPYVIRNKFRMTYMFCNNSVFIIKPNFQNELDDKLVGEFLARRARYECTSNNL